MAFGEILKIPHLIEHFQEHDGVGFFEFLNLHYSSQSSHKDSHTDNDCLPMKHLSTTGVLPVIEQLEEFTIVPSCLNKDPQLPFYKGMSSVHNLSPVWQPPKSA
ncbi:MAG: hypothetical protein Fur0041_10340 [Bacteroidia bacterium]